MFVKPANLGSSVGISKAHDCAELKAALKLAAQYDRKILVERGIEGREFECAVLGNDDPEASMPCEILPSREFYDYEDKYELNLARTVLPADLPESDIAEIRQLAVECFQAWAAKEWAELTFFAKPRRKTLRQRDQYGAGIHGDQYVSEDVGLCRDSVSANWSGA